MKLLDRFLRRQATTTGERARAQHEPEPGRCPHVALIPKWDEPADIGKDAKASRFECSTCSSTFTPAEARELRATEAERLRH